MMLEKDAGQDYRSHLMRKQTACVMLLIRSSNGSLAKSALV